MYHSIEPKFAYIHRHREKARIYLQTDLADAITTSFRRLNTLVNVDPEDRFPDDPIKVLGSLHHVARTRWIDTGYSLFYPALKPS
jgi:hypothetical protein